MIYEINTLKQLQFSVSKILPLNSKREMFFLQGPIGVGKSQWVRYALKNLGLRTSSIPSPTFSIHQTYKIHDLPIHHIDLFRIKDESELESIGFRDLLRQKKGYIFIEWSDFIFKEILPENWNQTFLKFYWEKSSRLLQFSKKISNF